VIAFASWAQPYTEAVIHSFPPPMTGSSPYSALIQASDGNLYGTTYYGGAFGQGTVFEIINPFTSPSESVVHSFGGGVDGAYPYASLIQAADGNLYGTTYAGGSNNSGTVFRIDNPSAVPTESVIYSFGATPTDGVNPQGGVVQGSDGNLYGTTLFGGSGTCPYGCGTVFMITSPSSSSTESVIYSFAGGIDGVNPAASLIQASDGNLYGTTLSGGGTNANGTVFKISNPSTAPTESVIHSFTGANDGAFPYAPLIEAADGNLYGSAFSGSGTGVIFRISNPSTSPMESVIHTFTGGVDGAYPIGGVIQATDSNLYGSTSGGGSSGHGTVFEINNPSTSPTESVLYSFAGGADGASPSASVLEGSDGNLYGTTVNGGGPSGVGTVFEISNPSTSPTESIIYSFTRGTDGTYPRASLIQATDGNLYGTAAAGGSSNCALGCGSVICPYGCGTVFEIGSLSTLPVESVIYSFAGGTDTAFSNAALIQASDGNLYGTSFNGGTTDFGTVFKISNPSTSPTESVVYSFQPFVGGPDGIGPNAPVIQASDGNLYGTTIYGGMSGNGAVFKINNPSTFPTESVIYSFAGGTDGAMPNAGLIEAADGSLYGTTTAGGSNGCFAGSGCGTVFRITNPSIAPTESVVYSFTGGLDGALPYSSLIEASDGSLYGTTFDGGSGGCFSGVGCGTVFRINNPSTSPTENVLYRFGGAADGRNPLAGLTQTLDGSLYGTTYNGGSNGCSDGCGTVFKIRNPSSSPVESVVYSFKGGADGENPEASLILAADGDLYGTTSGGYLGPSTVFQISSQITVSPECGPPTGGTTVTISGTGFQPNATVSFLGALGVVVSVTSTQIVVTTPAGSPGNVGDVVITNPGGLSTTTVNGWSYDFLDVPAGNPFETFVCRLVRNGITAGCGSGTFCPAASVLRSQIAVFLLRAEHGSTYAPPPCTVTSFGDVPCSNPFSSWIYQLLAEEITGGCGGGNFCPDDPVLRNSVAVLLLVTEHGAGYTPSVCTPPGQFTDVPCPGGGFTNWIYELVAEGITGGCTATAYCPSQPVTRAQMSVFLVTTFSLP
jgi:uncharacterized repeat protein (TIGR03803 family)